MFRSSAGLRVAERYRADIDGLRSLAVVPVVVFHIAATAMPGGFVGVDIFFVISGYLIAGILWRDIQADKFSIVGFYERRIRRIFPALFAVLLCSSIAAYSLFMPLDLRAFGASLASTVLFASNILFWSTTDYFDQSAELKPLLHTWSLAVEEQYYTFFPLLLFCLRSFQKRIIISVLIILAVASFLVSVAQVQYRPADAFYLPFGRVWELLIGALLAFGLYAVPARRIQREAFAFVGLLLVLFSVFFYNETTDFPGIAALPPVLGAALIIYAGSGGSSIVSRLLSSPLPVWIGKISYSLYLWHWPIAAFFRYVMLRDPHGWEIGACLAVMFAFAWLSWRFVETPFRQGRLKDISRANLLATAGVLSGLALVASTVVYLSHGLPGRLDMKTEQLAMGAFDTNPLRDRCDRRTPKQVSQGEFCTEGNLAAPQTTFALLGDSFGDAIAPGVVNAARENNVKGMLLTYSGCYPLVELNQRLACREFMETAITAIHSQGSVRQVVLVARWTAAYLGSRFGEKMETGWFLTDDQSRERTYEENKRVLQRAFIRTLDRLKGYDVVVIMGIPEHDRNVPRAAGLASRLGLPDYQGIPREVHEARQQELRGFMLDMSQRLGFRILDVTDRLCDANYCRGVEGSTAIYYDDNHLSQNGALKLTDFLRAAF